MREVTIIALGNEEHLIFSGNVKPLSMVNVNLKEEITEVVDGAIVHTYIKEGIPHQNFEGKVGKILK